jgi:hypothetical protein
VPHRLLQLRHAHPAANLRLLGVGVQVPAEERDDLQQFLPVFADSGGMLIGLSGEEEVDVAVVEGCALGGHGGALLADAAVADFAVVATHEPGDGPFDHRAVLPVAPARRSGILQ